MPIHLYFMNASPPCRAVLLTAAALNVKLNLITVDMMAEEHLKPEFVKINPQHTVPTLVDDGFTLWESRTIMRYLVNKYGGDNNTLYPKDSKSRAIVDQRLDFDIGTLYQRYSTYYYPQMMENKEADEGAFKKLREALEFLNTFLDGHKYAAGSNLTIADLALVVTVSHIEEIEIGMSDFPNIVKWFELVKTTAPSYQEANQKGVDEMKELMLSIRQSLINN